MHYLLPIFITKILNFDLCTQCIKNKDHDHDAGVRFAQDGQESDEKNATDDDGDIDLDVMFKSYIIMHHINC